MLKADERFARARDRVGTMDQHPINVESEGNVAASMLLDVEVVHDAAIN